MTTYRAALKEYGRPPVEYPIARECYVGSSQRTALDECKAALVNKYAAYAAWGMTSPLEGVSFEDFARDRFIIGDKASVKDEVLRYDSFWVWITSLCAANGRGWSRRRLWHPSAGLARSCCEPGRMTGPIEKFKALETMRSSSPAGTMSAGRRAKSLKVDRRPPA